MAKIAADTVTAWRARCEDWLAAHPTVRATLADIKTGRDAWTVGHCSGVVREAYDMGRDIHDAHIQTALQAIFPNAVFRDAKRY
jgi:hypothetical protein